MGSGIAQKMATEGFAVTLVDLDDDKVARGLSIIKKTLEDGVARGIFAAADVSAILGRVSGTSRFDDLAGVDLVVEAVFENLEIKKDVFRRLDEVCRPDTILATNTSSYAVTDLAAATKYPERVIGLHYFYHPAKNRLVEVVAGRATDAAAVRRAWRLQEALGKTPIASSDSYGFIVNRFFLPWLTEAIRMLEEGMATPITIDEAAKKAFGIGMGPFELMNVTGVPIAFHAATTLGRAFGPLYESPARLRSQTESGQPWEIAGTPDESLFATVGDRLTAAACYVAAALVDEGVGTIEDTDIGARVGLRWRRGPFELMNHYGISRARDLVAGFAVRWSMPMPSTLDRQAAKGRPFRFALVRSEETDGIATLTINRPDAMNAINEDVISQLEEAFSAAVADPAVKGIVIAGSGKAFIAGADIRYFVRHIEAGTIGTIASIHSTRPGTAPRHRDKLEACRCARPWSCAWWRRRARAGLPRNRRDAQGFPRLSRDWHRHLPRARWNAANATARRHRHREVAGALGPDPRRRRGAHHRPRRPSGAVRAAGRDDRRGHRTWTIRRHTLYRRPREPSSHRGVLRHEQRRRVAQCRYPAFGRSRGQGGETHRLEGPDSTTARRRARRPEHDGADRTRSRTGALAPR